MGEESRPLTLFDAARKDITALVDSSKAEPRLALDTESDPFHRYFEKVCLLQISTPREDYVIDPLALGMPPELRALLADPSRTLVLHGADYDVRSLVRSFELVVGAVFDTLIAASLLGLKTLGLKPLLETQLGVSIHKSEQRSDWGKRPLTPLQLEYARQDTRHLLPLAEKLEGELAARGRSAWMKEECEHLRLRSAQPGPPRPFDPDGWKKLKGARALGKKGQAALAAAFLWREASAQALDRPPFRIARSELLVQLAVEIDKHGLLELPAFAKMKMLPRSLDHAGLHRAIAAALAGAPVLAVLGHHPEHWRQAPRAEGEGCGDVGLAATSGAPSGPPDAAAKKRLDRLRAERAVWAEKLALDPGFLIAGNMLERLARTPPRTLEDLAAVRGLTAWRVEVIGREILAACAG